MQALIVSAQARNKCCVKMWSTDHIFKRLFQVKRN